jgi:hypothetical protein
MFTDVLLAIEANSSPEQVAQNNNVENGSPRRKGNGDMTQGPDHSVGAAG